MIYSLAADLLVLLHLAFVGFVIAGGLLLIRWWPLVFLHLPAVVWGALLEFNGWVCPLTPWEQQLRRAAGESGYQNGFVEHYLLPALYPAGLTRELQILLGVCVVILNLLVYGWLLWRKRPILH